MQKLSSVMLKEPNPSFFEVLVNRQSKRKFEKTEIDNITIEKIISYANSCPSAGNLQSYYIFAIKNQEKKNAIAAAAYGQSWVATAPCVLVFIALKGNCGQKYGKRGSELYAIQDATIACSHAQLIIHAFGMSCRTVICLFQYIGCWVGAFDEPSVGKVLGIQSITEMRPVAILPFGYSTQPNSSSQDRRKTSEIYTIMK